MCCGTASLGTRFVVELRRHFFKFLPKLPGNLGVHLGEAKPFVLLQISANPFEVPWHLRSMYNDLLATGHVAQPCARIQSFGVVTQRFWTQLCVLKFVRTDSRFACLMLSTKDNARLPDSRSFQHFLGLPAWGAQLRGASCSACPPKDISSRPSAATLHLWEGLFPTQCKILLWTPGLPERDRHPCNTQVNRRTFSFPAPEALTGSPHTLPSTRQTRFSVWKTNNDTKAGRHSPAWRYSQTTHTAAMTLRAWLRTFSPIFRYSSQGWHSYKCPETWTLVWTWTWPCFVCLPPLRRQNVWCGSQNSSRLNSDHIGLSWNPELGCGSTIGWSAFAAAPAGNRNPPGCIAPCLLRWRHFLAWAPPNAKFPDNLFQIFAGCIFWLCSECLPTKQPQASARFQTAGLLSMLLPLSNNASKTNMVACGKVSVFLSR